MCVCVQIIVVSYRNNDAVCGTDQRETSLHQEQEDSGMSEDQNENTILPAHDTHGQ